LAAEIEFQRGSTLARMGEVAAALACFSRALPVFEDHGDIASTAMTLHNRAMVHLATGDLGHAESDFEKAGAMAASLGRTGPSAAASHGMGAVAALQGDIPGALALFDQSEEVLGRHLGSASEVQVSRCEVLLSAGLFREAFALSLQISADLNRVGLAEDEAEARLVGAQAALLAGDPKAALSWAKRAEELFIGQHRPIWTVMARLTAIQVQYEAGDDSPTLLAQAREASRALESEGRVQWARRARLLAGMIGLAMKVDEEALADLDWVAERDSGPIESRIQSRLAAALARRGRSDTRGADAAARAGMRMLHEYQAALGATDIRVGVERHGRVLADLGLSLALESGNPRRVFRWMELQRGHALSHRPVTPESDQELSEDLAELRYVTGELRRADRSYLRRLTRRQEQLQASIRDRARLSRGDGRGHTRGEPRDVVAALADKTLIQLAGIDGRVWAVSIRDNRFRLTDLGTVPEITRESDSLRFSMRRLARGRGSVNTAREIARRLDGLLFGSLHVPEGPLVIVPTPGLHSVPWSALPTCENRSLSITPSTELWCRATLAGEGGEGTLLAAGPDLDMADAEISALSRVHDGASVFSSARSSVNSVLSHLHGVGLAHIACHAFFQFENPMFSSLRLTDGDLNVYDLERLGTAPDVVVLSACDSGFTDTHAGDELMGLSSALLSMGTRSIIASVGLVPDSHATKDLMVELHRGLASGLPPSIALQQAQRAVARTPEGYVAASSFICIGAG
jgi:hypothetical protein